MRDEIFLTKLKKKLNGSRVLVMEAKIDGASLYRDLCRLINNLLSVEFEEVYDDDDSDVDSDDENEGTLKKSTLSSKAAKSASNRSRRLDENKMAATTRLTSLEFFCTFLDIPGYFIEFCKSLVGGSSSHSKPGLKLLKEQAWFSQIQMDTLVVVHSYFSSQISILDKVSEATRKAYLKNANELLIFAGSFLNQPNDTNIRLKEKIMIVSG